MADVKRDGQPDAVAGRLDSGPTDLAYLTVLINNTAGPAMAPLKKATNPR